MTPEQVADWLGFPSLPPGRKIRQDILEGMAEVKVPAPGNDEEQIAAFRAFLACAGKPYAAILDSELTE